jgi:hypothetical protein
MSLLHIELIPAAIRIAFAKKVNAISSYLGINPDWLMQVMWAESKLKTKAANRQGKDKHLVAAGLLQFTTASGIVKAGLVPSIAHILAMDALEQLDLVHWYFKSYRGKLHSYYDVYAATFFPAIIGKADEWVLQTKSLSPDIIARQNPGIAKGKTYITVADFKRYAIGVVPKGLRSQVFGKAEEVVRSVIEETEELKHYVKNNPKKSAGVGAGLLAGVALCCAGWYILKK